MSEMNPQQSEADDPLIKEVRSLRRALCDEAGNDVDRLCDHLEQIGSEYRSRTGRFSGVPLEAPEELFPESNTMKSDPLLEEIRELRKGHGH